MKFFKAIRTGQPPFVLIGRTVGRSYLWTSQERAENRTDGGAPVDLPIRDALELAKLQKLSVVFLSNPERLHVIGVGGKAYFDKKEIGVVRFDLANELDDVLRAIAAGELLPLDGSAHSFLRKYLEGVSIVAGEVEL